ncbi:hypothetical protein FRC16_002168, partial [Serendipita sp. 398]
ESDGPAQQEPLPDAVEVVRDDEYLDREEGELYKWDNDLQGFVAPDIIKNPIEVRVVQTGQYQYYLIIKYKGHKILGHQVTDDMNGKGNSVRHSLYPLHLCDIALGYQVVYMESHDVPRPD